MRGQECIALCGHARHRRRTNPMRGQEVFKSADKLIAASVNQPHEGSGDPGLPMFVQREYP